MTQAFLWIKNAYLSLEKKEKIALGIWLGITLFCATQSLISYRYNNYLIFENTFRNLLLQQTFYGPYPEFHADANHYGPIFSVFMAPFALLPEALGLYVWDLFNLFIFYIAIKTIPLKQHWPILFMAIPALASSMLSEQFNTIAAAMMIFSYTLRDKHKGLWATLCIALGTFIKFYGVVGLVFFLFAKHKKHFVLYFIMWSILCFTLPMAFSSPAFILQNYTLWFEALANKNALNLVASTQNLSVFGFVRDLSLSHMLPNILLLMVAVTLFCIPLLKFNRYKSQTFQLLILASALVFPVLFSTGTEDCTYIIAMPALGIWYTLSKKVELNRALMIFAVLASCSLPLLLMPKLAHAYPLFITGICLPFLILWIQILRLSFKSKENFTEYAF